MKEFLYFRTVTSFTALPFLFYNSRRPQDLEPHSFLNHDKACFLFDSTCLQCKQAKKNRQDIVKTVKKLTGTCCQQLEVTLQNLGIQRQTYHGGSFVRNHVHKLLQVRLF